MITIAHKIDLEKEKDPPKKYSDDLNVFTYGHYFNWKYPRTWWNEIKQIFRNIKYAWQRATKGYCDQDIWNLDTFYTYLIRDSLKDLADNHVGYPDTVGEENWSTILHYAADRFDRSLERQFEDFQYYKNEYEKEYEEYVGNRKFTQVENPDGSVSVTFAENTPEQEEIRKNYFNREKEIFEQRMKDKDEGLDFLKKHWNDLWD